MAQTVIPIQRRYNDPYQQKILQFESTDPRVYLSRTSNFLLKSIGNDAIINGLDIQKTEFIDNEFSVTINPGLLIQDSTLIEIIEEFTLTLDISSFDSCTGKLILYTSYVYLESIEANRFRFKLAYITNDGLNILPAEIWDYNRNRIFLYLFNFDKVTSQVTEITNPDFFYINGKKYYRRGLLNFIPTGTTPVNPFYFNLPHNQNSYNIFSQLYDNTYFQKTINTLSLPNETLVKISVDEYKTITGNYQLVIADVNDCYLFIANKNAFDINHKYVLTHNLDQQYVMVQVYNDSYELVYPKSVELTSNTEITIDFSNLQEDLSALYKVIIIRDNITEHIITDDAFNYEQVLIQHDLNKFFVNTQLVNNTTNMIVDKSNMLQLYDQNNILFNTLVCDLGIDSYTLLVYKNVKVIFNLFNNDRYTIPYNYFTKRFTGEDLIGSDIRIIHNLYQIYPIVQLFDSTGHVVFADMIEVVNENVVKLVFNDPILASDDLTAVVYSYNQDILTASDSDIDPVTGEITIDVSTSNLVDPIIQIYDSAEQQIIPDMITRNTETNFTITFPIDVTLGTFHITATEGFTSYRETFSSEDLAATKKLISHNLDNSYPIVQIYMDDDLFYPDEILVINKNTIEIDFGEEILDPKTFYIIVLTGLPKLPAILRSDTSYVVEFNEDDLVDSKLTVDHLLNFEYPLVQVYDHENKMIIPNEIQIVSPDQVVIDFSTHSILDSFFKVVIMRSSI